MLQMSKSVRWLALLLLVVLAPAGMAVAQPENEPDAQPPTARRANTPQVMVTREFANGVTLVTQTLPGMEHTAIILMARTGSDRDASDAPGLSLLLSRLGMTAATSVEEAREMKALDRIYPKGWSAKSAPDHLALGIVVPSGDAADHLKNLAARARGITITEAAILKHTDQIEEELIDQFEIKRPLIPMSWLVVKTFRHPRDPRGVSPERLVRLSADRLSEEWQARMNPKNITVVLCGDVDEALVAAAEEAFGELPYVKDPPKLTTVKPVGKDVRREVQVPALPANKQHVVVAYYAPPITHADHPGYLAVAQVYMRAAAKMPAAASRLPFQYDPMLDARAAYMTPHTVFFPKGPGQALGYWLAKIENHSFSNKDGRRAMAKIGWELGDPLLPEVMDRVQSDTRVLYSIAYASAFRSLWGPDPFWEDYRSRLAHLSAKELDRIRQEYFVPTNWAMFLLREDEEGAMHRRKGRRSRTR